VDCHRNFDFLKIERDAASGWSVMIEDDGRVCYAYLISAEEQIVGDVWLCNRCDAPDKPEWTDRDKAPYANPERFSRPDTGFPLPDDESDISIQWSVDEAERRSADVLTDGLLIGRLREGEKPGRARAAAKDGPLAKMPR
jgi:hypothetical protein